MSGGSLIYLGKHGTIKIDQKGRPRLYQWPTIKKNFAGNFNRSDNYGPVTIRVEEDTSNYDWNYHQMAHKKSENGGLHFSLRPSTQATAPSMAVQRGTRIPVEVEGVPTTSQFTKQGEILVMPIQHTSKISIDHMMQQHLQQQHLQQQHLQQQHLQQQLNTQQHGGELKRQLQEDGKSPLQSREQTTQEVPMAPPPLPPLPVKAAIDGNLRNGSDHSKSYEYPKSDGKDIYSELQTRIWSRDLASDGNEDDESDWSYGTLSESLESETEAIPARVAVLASVDTVVMVQATCGTDSTCDAPLLFGKLAEIAKACLAYFRKLTSDKMELNSTALGHIKLADQRSVGEHVEDLQNGLPDSITVTAVGRKASPRKFVGTFINDPCSDGTHGPVSIGKTGVIVVLRGLNRLAPLKEFSDQICHHIALFKPTDMGKSGYARPEGVHLREARAKSVGLLEQAFLYDNTITVWEASRRAFIDVLDFTVLG